MNYNFFSKALIFLASIIFFVSCTEKQIYTNEEVEITELKAHNWYYFTSSNFLPIDLPQNAPDTAIKPWTESIRITAAGNQKNVSCALVNRLGILDFSSGKPVLIQDKHIFSEVTADTLLFTEEFPVFHLYRNSFFNQKANTKTEKRPLIIAYDFKNKICIPLLTYNDFEISAESEITNILPKDGTWLLVIKSIDSDKTNFQYLQFSTPNADGNIPISQAVELTKTEISADTFRQAQRPLSFQEAPEKLKELFAAINTPFEFYLSCRIDGNLASILYDNTLQKSPIGGYTSQGYAIVKDTGAIAIFSDGTTYISNTLLKQDPTSSGITVFRLPKLPGGFIYGEFSICGEKLYVAWEESEFYKTGRSGFIEINLSMINNSINF